MSNANTTLQVLLGLTRDLGDERTLEDALQRVTDAALALFDGGHASIRLLNAEHDELLCSARSGVGVTHRPVPFRMGEGVAGWVLEHGEIARIDDTQEDERFVSKEGQGFTIRSLVSVPLLSGERAVGVMTVSSDVPGAFDSSDEVAIQLLANCATPALARVRLRRLAMTDGLTQALNHESLSTTVERAMQRAGEAPHPLSVLLLDLDRFKSVNDTYFHAAGDRVLRVFADRVRSTVRREDMLVRRGGDEFVLVMPGASETVAAQTAERLREGLENDPIAIGDDRRVHQTVSVGVATWDGAEDSAALEARADRAMYVAKNGGRNRVAVAA